VVYLSLAGLAFLLFSAATALRPSRRGLFAVLAWPVGWAAGELPALALAIEAGLLVFQWWWGWPSGSARAMIAAAALAVSFANGALLVLQVMAATVVRRQVSEVDWAPLTVGGRRTDLFDPWWRRVTRWSFHPHDLQLQRNLAYGPASRHRLDIWRLSITPHGAPVIVYIHGGSWVFGDKSEMGRPMLHEMVRHGWIAVTINYRLAPADPMPRQIEDVKRALAWVKQNIGSSGGDPDRIVLAGGSAGGHLAALAALTPDDPTWRPAGVRLNDWSVRGCVSLYGVLEMTGDESHWRGLGRGLRHLLFHQVIQKPFEGHEELYESVSPFHRISLDAPPFLVVQGSTDTMVDPQVARNFVAHFRDQAVVPCYYVELPLAQHTFDLTASARTAATTRAVLAFATAVTTPRPPLTPALIAAYQSPPTELVVFDGGEQGACEVAALRGAYVVITPANPYSVVRSDDENERRWQAFEAWAKRHAVESAPSEGRDPSGAFPPERGLALWGLSSVAAVSMTRALQQNAYYEVTPKAVTVRVVR